jgi:hypothetical protein
MKMNNKSTTKIPDFKSREEEAEFWQTHSPLDFPDEFEEVEVKVKRPLAIRRKKVLSVRLEETHITQMAQLAEKRGIGASTLARIWILECLHQDISRQEPRHFAR